MTPNHAKPCDILAGGFEVIRKPGVGSTATALLVRVEEREYVLKVAVDADHDAQARDEGEVLRKLQSPLIVHCRGIRQVNDRTARRMERPVAHRTVRVMVGEGGGCP